MNKILLSKILMIVTIVLVAAFQCYWLRKLYNDEWVDLKKETDVLFRETLYKLQRQKFEKDSLLFFKPETSNVYYENKHIDEQNNKRQPQKITVYTFSTNAKDELKGITPEQIDSIKFSHSKNTPVLSPAMVEVFIRQKATVDSLVTRMKKDSPANIIITSVSKSNYPVKILKGEKLSTEEKKLKNIKDTILQKGLVQRGMSLDTSSPMIKFLTANKTINDSIPVIKVDSAYRSELLKLKKNISFQIKFKRATDEDLLKEDKKNDSTHIMATSPVLVGFNQPFSYQAVFENPFNYIIHQLTLPILVSVLLIILTALSFLYVYRNLVALRRLANIKNEFISNITHELKTPIATVSVAIEALKNFGAIQNPDKTSEYLNISESELQRLSLLVDKVLKLSMFESKEIELKKEMFDLQLLINDVISTMKLQLDKFHVDITLESEGDNFTIIADKLHITSVIYNLLDNALKYSKTNPVIQISLKQKLQHIELSFTDNGIGISKEYQHKIFDKFFRVPTNNIHNIKGYGLGLSYVAHVIKKHHGFIDVKSKLNEGSTFTITFPINDNTDVIRFDDNKTITKE